MKSLSALVVTRNGERIVGFILGLDCRDILVAADELQNKYPGSEVNYQQLELGQQYRVNDLTARLVIDLLAQHAVNSSQ